MTKTEFFEKLNEGLKKVRKEDRAEILADYEEHFQNALTKGKSEEQVCKDLGSVDQIITDYRIDRVVAAQVTGEAGSTKSILRAALILLAMAPLNFLFFVGPFVVTLSLLVASWGIGGSFFLIGIVLFFTFLIHILSSALIPVLLIGCVGVVALALFLMLLLVPLTRLLGTLTFKYLKWNLDFARGQ